MASEANNFTVWGFIKGFAKLLIGFLLLLQGVVGLVLLLLIAGIFVAMSNAPHARHAAVTVPQDSALLLNPSGVLVEEAETPDPFNAALQSAYGVQRTDKVELGEILNVIRTAKDDKRIKAMVLDIGGLEASSYDASKLYDIAAALDAFKASGKEIISVADSYSQDQYLIAAHANKVYLNDYGSLLFTGYGSYDVFLKSFLDKIKVTAHVFRVGTFKAAVEPFLRDDMSPEAKTANIAYLTALWDTYAANVEKARSLPAGSVKAYADNIEALITATGGDGALAAKNAHLVDELKSRRDQVALLEQKFGKSKDKDELFKNISWTNYAKAIKKAPGSGPAVAIVTVAGEISDGEVDDGKGAGGDTIASYLKRAREDDDVKAVVLRVDSPGGSAFASEIIRQEVLALKKAGKPVVVSMGSLAASGGYWVSAQGDKIFAAPTTITGSIGIFGLIPTFERAAQEWGVNMDGVGTSTLSSLNAAGIGPLSPAAASVIQRTVENGYQRFLDNVSTGRKLDKAYVDSIGQGRVWIGSTAKQIKLVDEMGTLEDAIKAAADLAKLKSYQTKIIRAESSSFLRIFGGASADASHVLGLDKERARLANSTLGKTLTQVQSTLEFANSFNDPNGVYARCMACGQ